MTTFNHETAMIMHDLKSPLAAMLMCVEELSSKEDCAHVLRLMRMNYDRIGEILASKEGSAYLEDILSSLAMEKSLIFKGKVTLDIHSTLYFEGDAVILKRALSNLMDNALESCNHLHIIASPNDTKIIISLIDDGPGISDEALQNFKNDRQSTSKSAGQGIGLLIAKSIIHSMNGELLIFRNDQGTTALICMNYIQ